MQEHDVAIFRGAALPSAVCGAVAVGVSAALAGVPGALGALLGVVVVLGCFGLGQWAVIMISRRDKNMFLAANLLGFVVKMAVLGILLITLDRSAFMAGLNNTSFVFSALACVLVWLGGQMWGISKAKILHVEPDSESGSA